MTRRKGMRAHLRRGWILAAPLVFLLAFPTFAAALEQKLTAADGTADDRFGTAVAIDGDTAVVGAPLATGGAGGSTPYAGAVYVFTRSGTAGFKAGG